MAISSEILLEARRLRKRMADQLIIDDVSLRVRSGDILTIIGLNGSGKTTLLRLLLGLLSPDSGEVIRQPSLRIGYLPQRMALDPVMPMTVGWFLSLHLPKGSPRDTMQRVCAETGIDGILQHSVHGISGGELQRVLLARALLCDPQLLVLDEPVQGVDISGQATLYELITAVSRKRGSAVLMVSHDLHLVMSSTTEVICLNHHICCHGMPSEVSSDPAFQQLFGTHVADTLALYHHHHDHRHGPHGEVIAGKDNGST